MSAMGDEPTVKQIYALAAALCSAGGLAFPERREAASELIERVRVEVGDAGPPLARERAPGAAAPVHAVAAAATAASRPGADGPRRALLEGERRRGRARARDALTPVDNRERGAQAGAAARWAKTFS